MCLTLPLVLLCWQGAVIHAYQSLLIKREFAVEVGTALISLETTYPQILTAGEIYNVTVNVRVIDLGDEKYVELRYIYIELEGTSIASSRVIKRSRSSKGMLAEEIFTLLICDPAFSEIKGGEKKRYDLKVTIGLFSENKDGEKSSVEYSTRLPVYVYSPPVYLEIDIVAPSTVIEKENFTVMISIKNIGDYNITESGVRIQGPIVVYGADMQLLGQLAPDEGKQALFTVKAEEKGEIIITAVVWAINPAGFNLTRSRDVVVKVKGMPKLELYANTTQGRLKLYGWLIPSRPFTTIILQEKQDDEWISIASIPIDPSGYFEYTIERPAIGVHTYRALWPGDEDYSSVSSEYVNIFIEKTASYIILSASTTTAKEGSTIVLKGTIRPSVSGTVYIFMDCGDGWKPAGYATVVDGEFEAKVIVKGKPGSLCRFKAVWPGSDEVLGSESNVVEVKVERREWYSQLPQLLQEISLPLSIAIVLLIMILIVRRVIKRGRSERV